MPEGDDISPRSMILNQNQTGSSTATDSKASASTITQSTSQQQQLLQQIDILGAVKVRDGLFLGDEFASQDLEFVIANKVTHIINCAGRQIFNQWTPVGVKYLTFYWLDDDRQVTLNHEIMIMQLIFDDHDQVAKEIFDFIEEANNESSGVLVHSVRGQSRACCVLSIYMMMKFKWTLLKSLEFINSRRPNLEIRASFLQQLSAWERRTRDKYPKRTDRWDELHEENNIEELLLRNTFMNAQMQPVNFLQQWKDDVLTTIQLGGTAARLKIQWADNEDENLKKHLARENSDHDLINKDESQIGQIDNHKRGFNGKPVLKKKQEDIKKEVVAKQQETPAKDVHEEQKKVDKNDDEVQKNVAQNHQSNSKKRPVTPLIKQRENDDLVTPSSPRSFAEEPQSSKNSKQQAKRANSTKRNEKEQQQSKEDKEKRDLFKARVAWNAAGSPREKGLIAQISTFKELDNSLNSTMGKTVKGQSPSKVSSSILKKELLEKAKKSLAEKGSVIPVESLDIKKIHETFNKISTGTASSTYHNSKEQTQIIQSTSNQKLPSGNIINNNNINNFFIQNASVIELQSKADQTQSAEITNKVQAPIGLHHHKRTHSSQVQMAQQMKQNLQQNLQNQQSHRKNQLSDQILQLQSNSNLANVPLIMQQNSQQQQPIQQPQIIRQVPSIQQSQTTISKKDFKGVIRNLQKDNNYLNGNSQMLNFLHTNHNQSQGTKLKSHTNSNQNLMGMIFPYGQSIQDKRKLTNDNSFANFRPASSSQKNIHGMGPSRSNSGNRSRKLKKSGDSIKNQTQQAYHRRAQTPMPQSPSQHGFGVLQIDKIGSKQQHPQIKQTQALMNPMIFYNHAQIPQPSIGHFPQQIKKRSKSPSISQHQQKLQAKTAYLLMNSTHTGGAPGSFMVGSIQAFAKNRAQSGYTSPKR